MNLPEHKTQNTNTTMIKRFLRISCIAILLFWGFVFSIDAGTLEVYLRDQDVRHTIFTLYDEQIEYIHLNKIADVFGLAVNIDSLNGRVIVQHREKSASFLPGRPSVIAERRTHLLDAPPRKIEGIIMVPLQFLTTIIPLIYADDMRWDAGTRRFIVQSQMLEITNLSFIPFGEYSRIIVEMNQVVSYKVTEKLPSLLMFEFPHAKFRLAQNPLPVNSPSIKHVNVVSSFGTTQIIVRLAPEFVRYTHQVVENPPRLAIDVYHAQETIVETTESEYIIEEDIAVKPEQTTPLVRKQFALRTVVIDPGHGGSDPGIQVAPATGETPELFEKQLALYLARMLQASLVQRFGRIRVVLTREGDDFVSAENRATIANHNRADAFISLHVNNNFSAAVSGFEVYVMDYGSIELPIGYEALSAQLDYAQAKYVNQSVRLAEHIVAAYKANNEGNAGRLKRAPLFTLKGATMPAVHVELSYASHPREQTLLKQEEFQQNLVSAIIAGIAAFKKTEETQKTP